MSSGRRHDRLQEGIVTAVETLSNIADLDVESEIAVAEAHEFSINDQKVRYRSVHWLRDTDAENTLTVVKDTFRVVLTYLKSFYRKEEPYINKRESIDGIQNIMVLVGEAAKKLERYMEAVRGLETGAITGLKEYQQLQSFYQKRIAPHSLSEQDLSRFFPAMEAISTDVISEAHHPPRWSLKRREVKNVYVDLDSVRRDTEYELFFLRKEDGSRFFNSRLIRNMKLLSDFGATFTGERKSDPLVKASLWRDKERQKVAANVLEQIGKERLDRFYSKSIKFKDMDLVNVLNKALMALMLCANPRNLEQHHPVKSCSTYFRDFQRYFRELLSCRDYEKYLAYPPSRSKKLVWNLVDMTHEICRALYTHRYGDKDLLAVMHRLIEIGRRDIEERDLNEALPVSRDLPSEQLKDTYQALQEVMKRHPHGALMKDLNALQSTIIEDFDPFLHGNLPGKLVDLSWEDMELDLLRIPSPTKQEFVNKATAVYEFRSWLMSKQINKSDDFHLLVNLQDRTAWRERVRCHLLEELAETEEYEDDLTVVSLVVSTDFYFQTDAYRHLNTAGEFKEELVKHLKEESAGYYFSELIHETVLDDVLPGMVDHIHQFLFQGKNVLTQRERLAFIDSLYVLLTLKLVEILNPTSLSFTCKDAVDTGATMSTLAIAILQLMKQQEFEPLDYDQLYKMLFLPALMIRERNVLALRFERMVNTIRAWELAQEEWGPKFSGQCKKYIGSLFQRDLASIEMKFSSD